MQEAFWWGWARRWPLVICHAGSFIMNQQSIDNSFLVNWTNLINGVWSPLPHELVPLSWNVWLAQIFILLCWECQSLGRHPECARQVDIFHFGHLYQSWKHFICTLKSQRQNIDGKHSKLSRLSEWSILERECDSYNLSFIYTRMKESWLQKQFLKCFVWLLEIHCMIACFLKT